MKKILICSLFLSITMSVTVFASSAYASVPQTIWVMALLALAIAIIIVRGIAYSMNSVRRKSCAAYYERDFKLTNKNDVFLYSRTTTQRISRNTSGRVRR